MALGTVDIILTVNEPLLSAPFLSMLPVSSLNVVQTGNDAPQVSWTHPGGDIAGYDIYLGTKDDGVKLNSSLLTGLSYTDTGYSGDERLYTVIAVDGNQAESPARSIFLPVIRAELAEGAALKRGIMNRLEYRVTNNSSVAVNGIRLKVNVNGKDHLSEPFYLSAISSGSISVIVGGYDDLPDIADLTATVEITPDQNEKVQIVRSSQIEAADGMLILQIQNEAFIRGGSGTVGFTLKNTGDSEIEITTAENSGNSASSEITWYLVDEDENVITAASFKQALGDYIVALSDGGVVARIPAGETFASGSMEIPVPLNAPGNVTLKLAVDSIYYHKGKDSAVKMNGLSTTRPVILTDTSYYGEVTSIVPENSTGDQDIVITGRAVESSSGDPLAGAQLNLVITLNGFERKYQVVTGDDGVFTYTFSPLAGESGVYTVRAVHPDLTDRPVHGQFVINKVSITPAAINLNIPYNYEKTININAAAGDGTEVNNLHLVYEEAGQSGGVFPEGVHVTLGAPVDFLGSGQSANLSFTIWADNTALDTGSVLLKVTSDENPDGWGIITVNTAFSEALPSLHILPEKGYVETGLAMGDTISETVTLQNTGLADMKDVTLSVTDENGDPAPGWVYLNSAADQGTIAVGESRQIGITFAPDTNVAEGMYTFHLHLESSNYQTTDIDLNVSVTQSGVGNILFKVQDIYTGTLDANDQLIQGVADARVKLQNEEVLTEEYTLNTDSVGEAYFTDLPAGHYKREPGRP